MNYLLYLESDPEIQDEQFILFETTANEETAKEFIEFYFPSDYQILGIFPTYHFANENIVERIIFTEEEVVHKLERKKLKEKTITTRNYKCDEYTQEEFLQKEQLEKELKETKRNMDNALYVYVRPENVTKELIQELKEKDFYRSKSSNGLARFRHKDHHIIREEYEQQIAIAEKKFHEAVGTYWDKKREYEKQNPIESFDDVVTYYSSQRNETLK